MLVMYVFLLVCCFLIICWNRLVSMVVLCWIFRLRVICILMSIILLRILGWFWVRFCVRCWVISVVLVVMVLFC